jgi:hypothetical protein
MEASAALCDDLVMSWMRKLALAAVSIIIARASSAPSPP